MIELTNPPVAIISAFHHVPLTIFVGKAFLERIITITVAKEIRTPRMTNERDKIEKLAASKVSLLTSPEK